jgi:putative SOS response-associated peptidase YedK
MCGRYALTKTELLEEFFEFSFTGHQIIPRFNIAPTTQIPVIRLREDGRRELIDMRWGLVPIWSKPGDKLPCDDQRESGNGVQQASVPRCV